MPDEIKIIPPPELPALLAALSNADRLAASSEAAKAFAPGFTRDLVEHAQAVAGSGPFARGWLAEASDAPGLTVTNNAGAAAFIELPTRPHIIEPVRAKMLAWMPGRGPFSAFSVKGSTKAGAGWIFAKKVHHPGTKGKFVFRDTIQAKAGDLFRALADEARAFLTGKNVHT